MAGCKVADGHWRTCQPLAFRYMRFGGPVDRVKVVPVGRRRPVVGRVLTDNARWAKMFEVGVRTLALCSDEFLIDGVKPTSDGWRTWEKKPIPGAEGFGARVPTPLGMLDVSGPRLKSALGCGIISAFSGMRRSAIELKARWQHDEGTDRIKKECRLVLRQS